MQIGPPVEGSVKRVGPKLVAKDMPGYSLHVSIPFPAAISDVGEVPGLAGLAGIAAAEIARSSTSKLTAVPDEAKPLLIFIAVFCCLRPSLQDTRPALCCT